MMPCRVSWRCHGKVHPGQVMLTRDARLKVFDEQQKKHREVPLKAIKRIDYTVLKEWVEEEWRFKENASDEKYFTGRGYPSREYTHKITLQNDRKIEGTLSGIVYVRADPARRARALSPPQARQGRSGNRPRVPGLRPLDPARRQGARGRPAQGGRDGEPEGVSREREGAELSHPARLEPWAITPQGQASLSILCLDFVSATITIGEESYEETR